MMAWPSGSVAAKDRSDPGPRRSPPHPRTGFRCHPVNQLEPDVVAVDGDDQPSVDSFVFRPRYQRTATVPRQAAARMTQAAITAAVTALLWLPLSAISATRPVIPTPIPAPAHAACFCPSAESAPVSGQLTSQRAVWRLLACRSPRQSG